MVIIIVAVHAHIALLFETGTLYVPAGLHEPVSGIKLNPPAMSGAVPNCDPRKHPGCEPSSPHPGTTPVPARMFQVPPKISKSTVIGRDEHMASVALQPPVNSQFVGEKKLTLPEQLHVNELAHMILNVTMIGYTVPEPHPVGHVHDPQQHAAFVATLPE